MKVLLVGSGGREHALAWAIATSPLCDELVCAPGNAGMAELGRCVDVGAEDVDGLLALAREENANYVVVGPEASLVAGLVDRLDTVGIKSFGPSVAAAALEGSKGFMKDFCARHNIPTAAYGRFTDAAKAKAFIREKGGALVVKTDGLAAGKGVLICDTPEEAQAAVDTMMAEKAFGAAGNEIVVEEFLDGEEASFFALCDGENALALASAQDHKRVGEGDTGPNTGGMGAYSPAPVVTPEMEARIMDSIIAPTVAGMKAEGAPYKGVLFAGLMITSGGEPQLLEFNVRFGDPECQVLVPRLKSDLLTAMVATSGGQLSRLDLRWSEQTALTVVMAAKGYPGSYEKGSEIMGLEAAGSREGVIVFHAGTKAKNGKIIASGGRVLGVTALGTDVGEAKARAYGAVDAIQWEEGFCRRDIGWRVAGT
ncbi:MAG: phosphoribosylamine--glycine ligase [Rhodospirillaceae bacterium]|nr:phosphoribosylamine--glycine ligase [Rhodospirillaceae bacterium]